MPPTLQQREAGKRLRHAQMLPLGGFRGAHLFAPSLPGTPLRVGSHTEWEVNWEAVRAIDRIPSEMVNQEYGFCLTG
jgi:hypothetical protein